MQWLIENLFWLAFGGVAAFFLFRVVRYGGFKAAMFGAKIEKTIGEVEGHPQLPVRTTLKVHVLGGGSPEKAVGIEFIAKSVASYQMVPVTLSVSEAKKLASLLQAAVGA